ncbi:MAG: hypothetical protein OEX18_08225 [Candidatus Krumholzibacteria bacterium]|nr:hypothetical protein [Candidatus Krumholzibacteria bacterium]MDH4337249.1 hypothetical protein [Candidatus Krumholzibacteria bacterium]MDH5268711.1 hypothetical protein [Candidatus Krumholzibacteria bacterium]
MAYSSSRTGNAEIWVIDRQTGSERQLTNRPAGDFNSCWSPDGREIAFASDQDGDYRLWVVAADGGALRMPGNNRITGNGPLWAPDGSSIGIISNAESGNALFLVDPKDGTSRKVLDHVKAFDWYRDANHVVYSPEGPGSEMRVGNLETGESSLLLSAPFTEFRVAPDGSGVDYCTAQSHSNMNLVLLPLSPPTGAGGLPRPAGPPHALTDGRGEWHVHNGGWSPDSKQVIYTRDTDTGDIYVLEGVK